MQHLLMLEHDEDDRYITQEYFSGTGFNLTVDFVYHGAELWHYLNTNPPPAVILLTYQAAPHTAVPILQQLKADEKFRMIPVIVLTGIANDELLRECYSAGANSVILKPATDVETRKKINTFLSYWMNTVLLPHPQAE